MKRGKIVFKRDGSKVYLLDGEEVTEAKFKKEFPDKKLDGGTPFVPGGWPLKSDALGVHPKQIKEVSEFLRKRGVPTEFTKDGRAILKSRDHRKAICQARGFFDRNGGYGDAAPSNDHAEDARSRESNLSSMIREACEAIDL